MGSQYNHLELDSRATRQNGAGTITPATGKVYVRRLIIGTTAAGTVSVQDGAGNNVAVFKASMPEGVYDLGYVSTGLKVVVAAASDITIVYSPLA